MTSDPKQTKDPLRDDTVSVRGSLILNADDWGRDPQTTDRTRECFQRGFMSSVSAMMFMKDSARAAGIAMERHIDAGLHLNFTTPFTAPGVPSRLLEHQERTSRFLQRWRLGQAVYHPALSGSFQYLFAAQRDEFCRLYGGEPDRYDGHHHMHLCANVLLDGLLPRGAIVRRNFSFRAGEKGLCNRWYRRMIDGYLNRRYKLTDYFYSLAPVESRSRLDSIVALAGEYSVEIETHPINSNEYRCLVEGELLGGSTSIPVSAGYLVARRRQRVSAQR